MTEDRKHYPNSGILFEADAEKKSKYQGLDSEGDGSIECPHCSKTVSFYVSEYLKNGARGIFRTLRFKAKKQQPQPAGSLGDFPSSSKGQQSSLPLSSGPVTQPYRHVGDDDSDTIPF
jgi:hypothetical protein